MFLIRLQRLPGQPPLPKRDLEAEAKNADADSTASDYDDDADADADADADGSEEESNGEEASQDTSLSATLVSEGEEGKGGKEVAKDA